MFHSRLWHQKSSCYSRVIFAISYLLVSVVAEQLTLHSQQQQNTQGWVIVSTLNGKLTALCNGQEIWTLNFTNELLSSNLHNTEYDNNGRLIRLIPSLFGGLYEFDGENVKTIPISMNKLLRSPFRYSDDLAFSGGNEVDSYGVSLSTGEILYECRVAGCKNNTDHEEYLEQDVLIIQRFQQTVRAVEVHTGNERWNFNVGQYDIRLIPANIYHSNKSDVQNIKLIMVISKGLIWAIDENNPTVKLWEYQFDSPIAAVWRQVPAKSSMSRGSLEKINLFDSSQWVWGSKHLIDPSLYLGIYEGQLYVQENFNLLKSISNSSSKYIQNAKYPWQLYPADVTAIASTILNENNNNGYFNKEDIGTTTLSVLVNSKYVNGNGFYLYSTDQLTNNKQCKSRLSDIKLITGTENLMYLVNLDLLWDWWREILIILTTITIFLTHRLLNTSDIKDAVLPPLVIVETKKNDLINDDGENASNFKSRYLTDFEPVDCLGKGGYGIVFEAKNKIDDCNYAIKRIALSNSRDSRERVMREVKALAKLDHHNIVRYFNAWLECPPNGWQREHDQQWLNKLTSSSLESSLKTSRTEIKPNGSVCINVSQTGSSSVDSAYEAVELSKIDMEDDSFVIFESSATKQYDNDVVCIKSYTTDNSNLSSLGNVSEKEVSNDTGHSESIVFEETDSNTEEIKHKRQKSISLDLNNKANDQKSAKMFLYIQMQLCQKLSLKEWLKQHTSPRDSLRVLNIFQQIVDAVDYVHLQGLIHRDLKPSNIFFAYDDKIKIGDFGLVTAMIEGRDDKAPTPEVENKTVTLRDSKHTACVGTHLYMSPEQINGQNYNYKVDIYSLGIIFFELLTPFFTEMERIRTLSDLKKSIFPKDFAENYLAEYNLLKMMLDEDPAKRPTTYGIRARPPLQNYNTTEFNIDNNSKWHFELPQLLRHSSTSSNSNGEQNIS